MKALSNYKVTSDPVPLTLTFMPKILAFLSFVATMGKVFHENILCKLYWISMKAVPEIGLKIQLYLKKSDYHYSYHRINNVFFLLSNVWQASWPCVDWERHLHRRCQLFLRHDDGEGVGLDEERRSETRRGRKKTLYRLKIPSWCCPSYHSKKLYYYGLG